MTWTGIYSTAEEAKEIQLLGEAWVLGKSEDVLGLQIQRCKEIARSKGLPQLPDGECYMINSMGEILK